MLERVGAAEAAQAIFEHGYSQLSYNVRHSVAQVTGTGCRPVWDSRGECSMLKPPVSHRLSVRRGAVFKLINDLTDDNARYFGTYSGYGERIADCCAKICAHLPALEDCVNRLQEVAPLYDFDEHSPGNGFRSLVFISDTALLQLVAVLHQCSEQRGSIVFRASHYCKELEAYESMLNFLAQALNMTLQSRDSLKDGNLFPPLDKENPEFQDMLKLIHKLDTSCFYGRPLGFQFSASVARIFRFIGIVLATYSLSWEKGHGPLGSLFNSGRFFLSPEQRAERIIAVTRDADIEFCKGFWNLSEIGNGMPLWFCPVMAVNVLRDLEWKEGIPMDTESGVIQVPGPSAHTGPRPTTVRVMSFLHREGVSPANAPNKQPLSPNLLFHCHGGGFVATSSKSHETYLRMWAKLLDCVVVSVEYSLAPENPFPRPTEEVLYSYASILNDPRSFGWTGERIVFVGDSAGGNLVMSAALRLIQLRAKRMPDALIPVYTPFLFQYLPSPSRVISVMDPLLHMGVVLRCVAAYTSGYGKDTAAAAAGHKSLQDYVQQVEKSSRVDFENGSNSIVSLVNYVQHQDDEDAKEASLQPNSLFIKENSEEPTTELEEELEDDNASLYSVNVESDPTHMHVSPAIFDHQLLDYLKSHPITKDDVTILDEHGVVVEDHCVPSAAAPAAASPPTNPKRGLLETLRQTASFSTPNTPVEGHKTLTSSASNNNIQSAANSSVRRTLSQSLAETAALAAGHAFDNLSSLSEWFERPDKKKKLERAASVGQNGEQPEAEGEAPAEKKSKLSLLLNSNNVPKDPLISPLYASDELIRRLPPCYFMACALDPLLDDTIAFARRLRDAGGKVECVDVLNAVPHGFLNFTLMSPECRQAAKLVLNRIKQAMHMQ